MMMKRGRRGARGSVEDVHGAAVRDTVVFFIVVDTRGTAVLAVGAGNQGIAGERDDAAEVIGGVGVGCLDILYQLPPGAAVAEHIYGAALGRQVVGLTAADARCGAVLAVGAHSQCIAVQRHTEAEIIGGAGVGGFDIRILQPAGAGRENTYMAPLLIALLLA